MKSFKRYIQEQDETLYTLELERETDEKIVINCMNQLLDLILDSLEDTNLVIYVDSISDFSLDEHKTRYSRKSIRIRQ